ncbi:MAG: oxidoreductase [Gammaproteobacteria bacterium]|nr:oxidoreductase [Gammaproteobacteria bacterium]|tara:strand:- start:1542 stop:2360 length:819 start_codon:yes stop_codon:yes gene_type:complete
MGQLDGKRAVIIGASMKDNIGQVMARRFRDEGAEVLVASRNTDASAAFAQSIGGYSASCDITQRADVFALAKSAKARMGGVDIAVNSSGLALGGPFLEFAEEDLDKLIALQFKGSYFFLQAMVGAMLDKPDPGGSIIQISSAVAHRSTTVDLGFDAYMGTKAGIDHVVRCVANQFGRQGIRANSIAMGHTDTPMHHDAYQGDIPDWMKAAFSDATPMGRYGTCDDVAAAAVWLACDECFMTGDSLQVNGGLTLRRNPLQADLDRYERDWADK